MVPKMRSLQGANQYTPFPFTAGDVCRLYEVSVGPFLPLKRWDYIGVIRISAIETVEEDTCAIIHYVDVNGREDTTLSWYAHLLRASPRLFAARAH